MHKEQKLLHQANNFLLIFLLFTSCNNKYKGDFEVIRCHYSDKKWPCYLKVEKGKYFVIDYIRNYENGKLKKYQGCASEGIYVDDFEKNGNYSKEDEAVRKLSISRKGNTIIFFEKEYSIIKEAKDSVYVKTENEYYVFIGTIPKS